MFYDREKCSSFALISWFAAAGGLHWLGAQLFPAPVGRLVSAQQPFHHQKAGRTRSLLQNCFFRWGRLLPPQKSLSHSFKQTVVYLLLRFNITAVRDNICLFFSSMLLDRCLTDVICYSFKCCSKSKCIGSSHNWLFGLFFFASWKTVRPAL